MTVSTSITIASGASATIQIQNVLSIAHMIVSNSTQYDLLWQGFGTQGQIDIAAGTQVKLDAETYNAGVVYVTASDTLGLGGQGSFNITSYLKGEPLPQGSWPATIPAQRVIASSFAGQVIATNLVNTQQVAGSNIITIQPIGDSNNTFTVDNSGNVTIGDAAHGGTLSVVGTSTFGSRVQGNGASNLRLDTGGVGRAIEFDASGVQQGFVDSNGLNINTFINYLTNSLVTGVIKGATSNNGLFFDTQSGAQTTNWGIGGTTIMQLAATFLSLNQLIQANNSLFSQGNGSVSGTLDLHVFIWGSNFKCAWIYLNGLNTASNTFVLFPSAMLSGLILPGDISSGTTGQLFNGATPVGVRQGVYSTVQGSAGSSAAQTNFRAQTPNTFLGTCDRLAINTTGGAGINNGIFIYGH